MRKTCSEFPIGSRVRYFSQGIERREVTGTVVAHYPGGDKCVDEESGEHYITDDHVGVRVDAIPDWWAYGTHDRFAPIADELELMHEVA
jgi:hypothetical protein